MKKKLLILILIAQYIVLRAQHNSFCDMGIQIPSYDSIISINKYHGCSGNNIAVGTKTIYINRDSLVKYSKGYLVSYYYAHLISKYYKKYYTSKLELYTYLHLYWNPSTPKEEQSYNIGYQKLPFEEVENTAWEYFRSNIRGITIGTPDTITAKEILKLVDFAYRNKPFLEQYRDSMLNIKAELEYGDLLLPRSLVEKILTTPNRRVDKFLRQEKRRQKRSK